MRRLFFFAICAAALATPPSPPITKFTLRPGVGARRLAKGSKDHLNEAGLGIDFLIRDAGRDPSMLPAFIAEGRAEQVDLILTWGTSVTRGVAGNARRPR